MSIKKSSVDNWNFLEEIDAPMWVDLALDSKSMDQDIDDEWFQVAHPSHQCSSHHLISAFSVSNERKTNSNADLLGPSSPKLPSSVSRSRGKHYRSRKWRGGDLVSMDKQHPIRDFVGNTSRVVSGSCHEIKPKTKSSFRNTKGVSSSKASLVGESNSTKTMRPNSLKTKPSFRNLKSASISKASLVGERNSIETMRPNPTQKKPSFVRTESTLSSNTSSVVESNSTIRSGLDSVKPKSSFGDSRSSYTRRPNFPKTKPRFGDSESTSSLNENFIGDSNSTSFNGLDSVKTKSRFRDSNILSNSNVSTVTESNQQEQQTVSEVSHQMFGHKSGLLSAVRISLRKSCVTRQASRVEIKEKRQSKGCKSPSGKSSMGSTTNSGCKHKDTTLMALMNKKVTSESREVVKMDQPTRRGKVTNVCKTSNGRFLDLNSDSKQKGKAIALRSVHQETSKSKVVYQSEPRKSSCLNNVQVHLKDGSKAKKSVANTKRVDAGKKANGKENIVGSMVQSQKASKNGFEVKDDKALSDPKGKGNGRNKGQNLKNVVQRFYYR